MSRQDDESRYVQEDEDKASWQYVEVVSRPIIRRPKGREILEFRGKVDGEIIDITVWDEYVHILDGVDGGDTIVGTIHKGKIYKGKQQHSMQPSFWKKGGDMGNGDGRDDRRSEDRDDRRDDRRDDDRADREEKEKTATRRRAIRTVGYNDPLFFQQSLKIMAVTYGIMLNSVYSSARGIDEKDASITKAMEVAQGLTSTLFIAITNGLIAINRAESEAQQSPKEAAAASAEVDVTAMVRQVVEKWKRSPVGQVAQEQERGESE